MYVSKREQRYLDYGAGVSEMHYSWLGLVSVDSLSLTKQGDGIQVPVPCDVGLVDPRAPGTLHAATSWCQRGHVDICVDVHVQCRLAQRTGRLLALW